MAKTLTFENQPALPTDASPSANNASAARIIASSITQATHSTDPDALEEEDPQDQPHMALDSDEEEEDGADKRPLREAKEYLRRLVADIVEKMTTGEEIVIRTVVPGVATHTRRERVANFREKGVGLKGGIPTFKDCEVDLLSQWLDSSINSGRNLGHERRQE
jgi:hypothetical protein